MTLSLACHVALWDDTCTHPVSVSEAEPSSNMVACLHVVHTLRMFLEQIYCSSQGPLYPSSHHGSHLALMW